MNRKTEALKMAKGQNRGPGPSREREKGFEPSTSTLARAADPFRGVTSRDETAGNPRPA